MVSVGELLRLGYFLAPACVADASPIVARKLFPDRNAPLDDGRTLRGERLLGSHKTWRGLASCAVAGSATYTLQRVLWRAGVLRGLAPAGIYGRYRILPGLLMGIGAGLGDAAGSFAKRRLRIPPGRPWIGFDQLDFLAGAVLLLRPIRRVRAGEVAALLPLLFLAEIAGTAVAWRLGLKERWV